MDPIQLSASLLLLSQLVAARAIGPGPDLHLRSRSNPVLSTRAKTTTARKGGLGILAIVIIVVIVLAATIGLVALVYLCYRQRQNRNKGKTGHNMDYIATPPAPGENRPGDWWQPPESTNNTLTTRPDINNNRGSLYGAGGQGYAYGQSTVDHHRASRLSPMPSHSPVLLPSQVDHRTSMLARTASGNTNTSGGAGAGGPQDPPFQIPMADYYRPRPPPSISPSYHTMAAGGDMSVEAGAPAHSIPGSSPLAAGAGGSGSGSQETSTPQHPISFPHRQQTIEPLQPQQTGTSIYSSPYEITAMTRSTSGHPGSGH